MRLPARFAASTCMAVAALAAATTPAAAKDKWKDLLGGRQGDRQGAGLEQGMVDRSRYESPQAEGMSLDRAVEMVQRRYNARVVRAEQKRDGGQTYYRIRLLSSDGNVFDVTVDPRTGEIR